MQTCLAPERVSVPLPAFSRPKPPPPPLITPPTVRLPADVVTSSKGLIDTAPVPKFSALLPTNVKFPLQVWALLLLRVTDAPLVLSIFPPLIVNVPVPIAAALLMFNWATDASVVPPE